MCLSACWLGLLLLAPFQRAAAPVPAAEEGLLSEAYFPGAVPLDERGRPTHAVVRIVDATTRRPIPGARLRVVSESPTPLPGESWWLREALADPDGFTRVRIDDLEAGGWFFLEAPGYAAEGEHGSPAPLVTLEPAVEVDVEVRDPWGRPVPGALLGRLVGCGHTPDVATWRTDARGRALLSGLRPGWNELWPVAAGCASDYVSLEVHGRGGGVRVVRLEEPGIVVEGVLVDATGKPMPQVFVGQSSSHRGPWTQADSEGRFRFVGASRDGSFRVQAEEDPKKLLGHFSVVGGVASSPIVVRKDEPEDSFASVVVRVRDGQGGPPQPMEVRAMAEGGLHFGRRTQEDGWCELLLPAGRYELRAGEWGLDAAASASVVVPASLPDLEIDLELRPLPVLQLRGAESLPEGAEVELVGVEGTLDVTKALRNGKRAFPMPAEGPLAAVVRIGRRERVTAWVAGSGETVDLVSPVATEVRGQLPTPGRAQVTLSADASADRKGGDVGVVADDGSFVLRTFRIGSSWLHVRPEDGELEPMCIPLFLEEQEVLNIGDLRARPRATPSLVVRMPDGAPAAGAALELRRDGVPPFSWRLDERGAFAGGVPLRAGDRIRVDDREGRLPLDFQLEGEGPWELMFPAGVLEVRAVDPGGAPVEGWVALLEGVELPEAGVLRGVPAGRHQLVVAAVGRWARVFELDLADGEHKRVRAVLPRK